MWYKKANPFILIGFWRIYLAYAGNLKKHCKTGLMKSERINLSRKLKKEDMLRRRQRKRQKRNALGESC